MKLLRLALALSAVCVCALRAQISAGGGDDDQQQQKPPTEIPDFNNLDEFIYVPKSNLNYGYRYTSGVKASFSGKGYIASPEDEVTPSAANVSTTYHDGTVGPDSRTVQTDLGNGTSVTTSVNAADGKTNTWSYDSTNQVTSDGFLTMHDYSANTTDGSVHDKTGKGNAGLELFVSHDMKKLTRHLEWKLFGGMSINDIQASTFFNVSSTLNTLTNVYDLYGVTPPSTVPYSSPSSSTVNVVDSSGNQVTDTSGNPVTVNVDNSILISAAPIGSSNTSTPDTTDSLVQEQFKLHGAYATFRVGPQLMYDFNDHLKISLSAGPAVLFAGSTLQVNEVLNPPSGDQIVDTVTNTTNRLLLGYYVDATAQYDLTDRTGFYFGIFDQSAGSYNQSASAPPVIGSNGQVEAGTYTDYTAKVDFSNQEGVRTGLTYKF